MPKVFVDYWRREEVKDLMRDNNINIIELHFLLNLRLLFDVCSEDSSDFLNCNAFLFVGVVDPVLEFIVEICRVVSKAFESANRVVFDDLETISEDGSFEENRFFASYFERGKFFLFFDFFDFSSCCGGGFLYDFLVIFLRCSGGGWFRTFLSRSRILVIYLSFLLTLE